MKEIIPAVDRETIQQELTKDKFLRYTNYGGNELYIVDYHNSPNLMQEIGRLREISFRSAGGGTGKEIDIDEFDTCKNPYQQLIVWDPEIKEILGGYRYFICTDLSCIVDGEVHLSTSEIFRVSQKFTDQYLPHMIELGRSFVQPQYQSTNLRSKGLYALDNLWDGLGAIWINHPDIRYFFGKVTMYKSYNEEARNMILYFLDKYFGDPDKLITPLYPLDIEINREKFESIFTGNDLKEDQKILSQQVRARGENIPPLINAYMNLSPTMKCFGTSTNPFFGDVEETAIMITAADFYQSKTERHVNSYLDELRSKGIQLLPGMKRENTNEEE
ncbi:MAG: GNAT family N-acetyltransferase [Bacteroidetes bacterium]|nr:GNAT family N-acetyltransferase [Bacteroidota bacterium]